MKKSNLVCIVLVSMTAIVLVSCVSPVGTTGSVTSRPTPATRASDSEEGFSIFAGEVISVTHTEIQLKVMQKIVTLRPTETTNYLDKDGNKIASTTFKTGDYVRTTALMKSKTVITLMKAE